MLHQQRQPLLHRQRQPQLHRQRQPLLLQPRQPLLHRQKILKHNWQLLKFLQMHLSPHQQRPLQRR